MNIALYHNLPSGGARRAMVEMVKGLVDRGHTVDEYCPQTADLTFLPLSGIVRRTIVLPFRPLGAATTRVPFLTPYITTARLTRDLLALRSVGMKAARSINSKYYDVVFTHDCQLVYAPGILPFLNLPTVHYCHSARGMNLPTILDTHLDRRVASLLKHLYYAPAGRIYHRLRYHYTRCNLQAAQSVLVNSAFTMSELQQIFGVASQICRLGVDTTHFRPLNLPRETFVLSVGAVHHHKGYHFLLQALAKLPEAQRPPLIIAANSAEQAELQAIQNVATDLGVQLEVRCVLDDSELLHLYNRAAAFVYCPIREPWGLAAIEAMACGTAIVAVGEGGVTESVIDGTTGLLTGRDTDSFAAAMIRVLSDPNLAGRLGAAGVSHARSHFTWASTIDCLEQHLANAVEVWPSI